MTIIAFNARTSLFAALLALPLAAGLPAHAAAQDAASAPHLDLNLQGMDLTTPQGMVAARHRVANAARAVCMPVTDVSGFRQNYSACVQTARNEGNRQLQTMQQQAMLKDKGTRTLAMQVLPKK